MKKTGFLPVALSVVSLALLLNTGCASTGASGGHEDPGYFLNLTQKGQLIGAGRIQDSEGTWYDVLICPGYKYPMKFGWRNLKQGGRNLGEYFGREKYRRLFETSGDCLEWAFEDCLWEFGFEGSGKAWGRHFGNASKRVNQRVFGWWLAYPWALMQSVVETAFRIPVGCIGTALGTASGLVIVPAYHLTDSGVKAVWNGGVEGLVLPVTGLAWNTVVSPPLALFGQKPSKSRADGFWVRMVGASEPLIEVSEEDLKSIMMWGRVLERELTVYAEKQKAVNAERQKKAEALYKEMRANDDHAGKEQNRIMEEEKSRVRELVLAPEHRELVEKLKAKGWSSTYISRHYQAIRKLLDESRHLSPAQRDRVMQLLGQYAAVTVPTLERVPLPEKRNPVTESINVIKQVE